MGAFELRVDDSAVSVALHGALEFRQTNEAIRAAAMAAKDKGVGCVLFDLRDADIANYYSYTVRHAEIAPQLGLDTSFRIAFLGRRESFEVLAFMELVARNHGWTVRAFTDSTEAQRWAAGEPPAA